MYKLLVVDGEQNIRLLYKEEFQNDGYEVIIAATAEEAIKKIRQNKPDIITFDIKKPGTDGIEFMRGLREKKSDIPVVLSSSFRGFQRDFLVLFDAYVIKSADLSELKTRIKQILADKQEDLALY